MGPLGDRAIQVDFAPDRDNGRKVRALLDALAALPIGGVVDCVAGYNGVAVHYDPRLLPAAIDGYSYVTACLRERIARASSAPVKERTIEVPVCYGGIHGPDLPDLAGQRGLGVDQVIALHSGARYRVELIGFAPGFPYLSGLDRRLATPRRDTPRTKVPPGSVGIGGSQTGIYSTESPGGWSLIGRTPLKLFDPLRQPPALLQMADWVKFVAIDAARYEALVAL